VENNVGANGLDLTERAALAFAKVIVENQVSHLGQPECGHSYKHRTF